MKYRGERVISTFSHRHGIYKKGEKVSSGFETFSSKRNEEDDEKKKEFWTHVSLRSYFDKNKIN